jgi:hypothetical protein
METMMKIRALSSAIVLVGGMLGYSQFASAQACSTPDATLTGASLQFSGNNCTHNTNFSAICSNTEGLGGGGMDVIQFDLAATNNVQVTLQSAAFTPELGVIGSPCSSSTTCIIDQTIAAPGTVGPVQVPQNSPAGSYFIFVTNVADAACGAYNVSLTGTLPVKLENFSVE